MYIVSIKRRYNRYNVDERFLAKILSEIMQSMENAKHQLNKLVAWPRRRADKLSATALRPSTLGGSAQEFQAAWPAQRSRYTFNVCHPVTVTAIKL